MGGTTPLPGPEGEPRTFTVRVFPETLVLKLPLGRECVSIEVMSRPARITLRRNESVTFPIAQIQVTGIGAMQETPRPKFPWPEVAYQFAVNEIIAPGGFHFPVGYWVDGSKHRVELPQTSRGIRNVEFLSDDEEFVLALPAQTQVLTWDPSEAGRTTPLNAHIIWRIRPDGTRG
jgi:hypothetical protein